MAQSLPKAQWAVTFQAIENELVAAMAEEL
jgi:hypothetical protein